MRRRTAVFGLAGAGALAAASAAGPGHRAHAQAAPAVDLLLVLAVDASGSIDPAQFRFQREGIVEALTHPSVLSAIQSKPIGAIAVAMVEWGSPGGAATVVDWVRVADESTAQAAAAAMLDAPRSPQTWNAIGDAIAHSAGLIAAAPFRAEEKVIDLSGDAPDMRGHIPAPEARDAAVAAGITVNALAIEEGAAWRGEVLAERYERDVIGGPGAFVMAAADRRDFARALRAKLVQEIAGREVDGKAGLA